MHLIVIDDPDDPRVSAFRLNERGLSNRIQRRDDDGRVTRDRQRAERRRTLLDVVGLQRRLSRRNLAFVPKLVRATRQATGLLRELRRSRNTQPSVVRENLGWEEVARLEFNAPDLPGVFIDLGQTRDYPEGELMSHIVGYTGRVADEDLAGRDDPVLQLATMRFGKKGVERAFEDDLRGRAGAVQVEVNAVGRVVRELDRTEGQPGANVLLTIDMDIQRFAAERMKEHQSGSVVVMDVITGDIDTAEIYFGIKPDKSLSKEAALKAHKNYGHERFDPANPDKLKSVKQF